MTKLILEFLAAFGLLSLGAMRLAFHGPRVADAELIFRDASDGAIVADETTTGVECGPFALDGLPFRLTIPTDASAATTLAVVFQGSDTVGGTYVEVGRFSTGELDFNSDGASDAGVYRKRVYSPYKFLRVFFDVTGAGGSWGGLVDLRAESAGEGTNARRDL